MGGRLEERRAGDLGSPNFVGSWDRKLERSGWRDGTAKMQVDTDRWINRNQCDACSIGGGKINDREFSDAWNPCN
jgi:hypothetical protein